jgi:hypothetical protein
MGFNVERSERNFSDWLALQITPSQERMMRFAH